MKWSLAIASGIAALLTLAASGCNTTTVAGGGSGGTGATAVVSHGSISDIGSIWVNGVRYDTTGASITLADGSSFIDQSGSAGGTLLQPGMIVTVSGTRDGQLGQAGQVVYHRGLLGPIAAVAPLTGRPSAVMVLGQRILIDVASGVTRLEPADGWVPAPDDWVEVSGFARPDGVFHASYLRHITPRAEALVDGRVTALDPSAWTYMVNGATLVAAPVAYDLPAVGTQVAVSGVPGPSGELLASMPPEVRPPHLPGEPGVEVELEGVVTAAPVGGEFMVAGQGVVVNGDTRYKGGSVGELVVGTLVEVEGTLNATGRVEAIQVHFKDAIEIEAVIARYDGDSFTLAGLGSGLVVHVDAARTRLLGDLVLAEQQPVKLRGRAIAGDGTAVLATVIEAGSAEQVQLQGMLEQVALEAGWFRVLGTEVAMADIGRFELRDVTVDAPTFFAQVVPGQLIVVEGTYATDGGIAWSAVALEE